MYLSTIPQFTTGRKKIFCYEDAITEKNVINIVKSSLVVHNQNVQEIEWLFQLYRGMDTEILYRTREGANSDINHKAFVSYYSLIADYAANLFMQNPMVLVNIDGTQETSENLMEYSKIQRSSNKYARDKTTAFHVAICGVGYRFSDMDSRTTIKDSVLSPTSCFSIYGDDTEDEAMARVYITQVNDQEQSALTEEITQQAGVNNLLIKKRYNLYTNTHKYTWVDGDEEPVVTKLLWGCPIIEYKMNPFYIGSFERVTSLIQLLSILRSDGVNGVVQSVAGILFGKNIGVPMDGSKESEEKREIHREQLKKFRQMFVEEGSKEKPPASLEYIATEMYNADIDVLYQGILNDIITITRTPNSVVNMGGSGNAGAAQTASGAPQALENAKNAEPYWFESTREHARLELAICHYKDKLLDLNDGDFEFAMQRSIMTNPITSTQAYETLINTGVKPSDAARITDMSADPETWEKRVMEYREEEERRKLEYVRKEQEILGGKNESTTEEIIIG